MAERQVTQNVRDTEYAEFQAEKFFGVSELAQPIFLFAVAYYFAFLKYNPELSTAVIVGASALLDKFLHGKFHQIYENRREIQIAEQLQRIETPVPMNY